MNCAYKLNLKLLIIGIFTLCDAGIVIAKDDAQYWNELILIHAATQKLDFHIKFEQRIVDDFSRFVLHNYAPGVLYKFNKHFDVEFNYKFEREKGKRQWINEHRLELAPIIKWQWNEFSFKLRNRLEYRLIAGDDSWRIRGKIKISRTLGVDKFYITPYLSEEIFYDFRVGDFNQNRVSIGLSTKIISSLEMSVYYLFKSNKRLGKWTHANVLGTELVIVF